MRVALIGFMCSGKTTVGRILARQAEVPFTDLDRCIEERIGPITPYFAAHGEEAFRAVEHAVLGEVLARDGALVLATGGGTPLHADNLERLQGWGEVVLLKPSFEVLLHRIERTGGDRPQLFGLKGKALHERVRDLWNGRERVYDRADRAVDADYAPDRVAERILDELGQLR